MIENCQDHYPGNSLVQQTLMDYRMKIERIHTQEELAFILEHTVPEPNRQLISQTYNYMRGNSKDRLEEIVSSFQKVGGCLEI